MQQSVTTASWVSPWKALAVFDLDEDRWTVLYSMTRLPNDISLALQCNTSWSAYIWIIYVWIIMYIERRLIIMFRTQWAEKGEKLLWWLLLYPLIWTITILTTGSKAIKTVKSRDLLNLEHDDPSWKYTHLYWLYS